MLTSPRPAFVAILGPTATGKSALAVAVARHFDGEIVACDSTAVYRGFDIGTDKVPPDAQHGIPHHLVDVAAPTEVYTAARYAADAAAAIRAIHARGRLPVVRARLERVAARRGDGALHRWLGRVDPASAVRIQPRDRKRMIRALEVYCLTGRPLTTHFDATAAPLPEFDVHAVGVRLPADVLADRLGHRVDAQLAAGLEAEVRALLARGVPRAARPFGGLVYRQMIEYLDGVRGLAETRALIVQENRRYARRQLIWFRKEPTLVWFDGPGETAPAAARVIEHLGARGLYHHRSDAGDG